MKAFPVLLAGVLMAALAAPSRADPKIDEIVKRFSAAAGQPELVERFTTMEAPAAFSTKSTDHPWANAQGKIVVSYQPSLKEPNKKWEKILRDSKIFEREAQLVNQQFYLPFDIPFKVHDCAEDGEEVFTAAYDSNERVIDYCYDELTEHADLLQQAGEPPKNFNDILLGDVLHTFYHELGHALIDLYQCRQSRFNNSDRPCLPIVGVEEDTVDQFAALMLISKGEDGELAARMTAKLFRTRGNGQSEYDFADVHSTDHQRFYHTLCLIYGKDPKKYASLVGGEMLPSERATSCPDDYARLNASWDTLLAPFRKPVHQ